MSKRAVVGFDIAHPSVARKRKAEMKSLEIGVASYDEMKARLELQIRT